MKKVNEYELTIEDVLADQPDLLRAVRAIHKFQRERDQLQVKLEVTGDEGVG